MIQSAGRLNGVGCFGYHDRSWLERTKCYGSAITAKISGPVRSRRDLPSPVTVSNCEIVVGAAVATLAIK